MWTIYSLASCILLAYAVYQGVSWSPAVFRLGLCIYRGIADGWPAIPTSLVNRSTKVQRLRVNFVSRDRLFFRAETEPGRRVPPGILQGVVVWTEATHARIELRLPISWLMVVAWAGVGLGLSAREGMSPVDAYVIAFFLLCGLFTVLVLIDRVSFLYGISALKAYLREAAPTADEPLTRERQVNLPRGPRDDET